jgi:hypothetical protein
MPQQDLGPCIDGHDGVKGTRLGIDIELQEDFFDGDDFFDSGCRSQKCPRPG